MTEYIKEHCPPSECIYVGIGRSPTPVLAILESSASNHVTHLPLTYGREFKDSGRGLTALERERLFQHFDHFMPHKDILNNKKILLIDFTLSGDGLELSSQHIKEWAKSRSGKFNVSQFAIDLIGDDDTPSRKYISLSDDYKDIADKFVLKKYSEYSKYGQFQVAYQETNPANFIYSPPQLNPRYDELRLKGSLISSLEIPSKGNKCITQILDDLVGPIQ